MAEVPLSILPEQILSVFRILSTIIAQLPISREQNAAASHRLRSIVFDLYNELIYLLRFHQIDYRYLERPIHRHFEFVIQSIHDVYRTDQLAPTYTAPH